VSAPIAIDETLIRAVARGDRSAMQTLFIRHRVKVFRFVLRLVRNRATAEDLTADVFLDVWRNASRFEGRSAAATWILAIARFKALSALRRSRERALEETTLERLVDHSEGPEVVLANKHRGDVLRACLARLSLDHREVIDLVYYHEKSVEEVAEIVGIPKATVKRRMFYARKRLSELLKAAGIDRGWP
jgi:RNA polymerase sigma-70 factor (ECF subfamily)